MRSCLPVSCPLVNRCDADGLRNAIVAEFEGDQIFVNDQLAKGTQVLGIGIGEEPFATGSHINPTIVSEVILNGVSLAANHHSVELTDVGKERLSVGFRRLIWMRFLDLDCQLTSQNGQKSLLTEG